MSKHKNTVQRGSVRYIIFKEGSTFFGAALEFNIIVEGTHPTEVLVLLSEAVAGYVESAKKVKARPHILNQRPDPAYEKMWSAYRNLKLKEKQERIVNNLPIFNAGWLELAKH